MPTQPTGDELAAKGLDTERSALPPDADPASWATMQPDVSGDAPLTMDQIKAALEQRYKNTQSTIINATAERTKLNRRIKAARAEQAEVKRIINSLTPRSKKS